jgi:predicted metalloprotease with PDZ domain
MRLTPEGGAKERLAGKLRKSGLHLWFLGRSPHNHKFNLIKMKSLWLFTALTFGCLSLAWAQPAMNYQIAVRDGFDNDFFVTLALDHQLDKDARLFQFASTAPGTYQTMDIGRYVHDFEVLDKKGRPLEFDRLSVNQFEIKKPRKVRSISYRISETWDTKVRQNPIYPMAGSSLELDHAMISPHALIGYFLDYQDYPYGVALVVPADWQIGTALKKEGSFYRAESYDHLVDSPLLAGELTYADTLIDDTQVEIYTYSKNGVADSRSLLNAMHGMLAASKAFLKYLPAEHYTFLFHFEPRPPMPTGAWEHSLSSQYVFSENREARDLEGIVHIAAHEFFHIVTPLNLHSEKVEPFNFIKPDPSQHLWFYEGVTEWGSLTLLLRDGKMNLETYLNNMIQKIQVDGFLNKDWSLKDLATRSYTPEGQQQFVNVYCRGALVAALLDIRLLKLSDGKQGLREVILKLLAKYGKGKPFSEDRFFDELVEMTYPEIRTFIDDHILDNQALPIKEYFGWLGIDYRAGGDGQPPQFFVKLQPREAQLKLRKIWLKNL